VAEPHHAWTSTEEWLAAYGRPCQDTDTVMGNPNPQPGGRGFTSNQSSCLFTPLPRRAFALVRFGYSRIRAAKTYPLTRPHPFRNGSSGRSDQRRNFADPREYGAGSGQFRQLGVCLTFHHGVATGGGALPCLLKDPPGPVGVTGAIAGTEHPTPQHVGVRLGELHLAT